MLERKWQVIEVEVIENQGSILRGAEFCTYRVLNKEGQKILGYKTHKKCVFEAIKMLIASKNMGHFDIQSSFI